jgi:hypothetical protein
MLLLDNKENGRYKYTHKKSGCIIANKIVLLQYL